MRFIKTVLLCIAFAACNQPRHQPVNTPEPANETTINDYIPSTELAYLQQTLAEAPQTFTVAANTTQTITAKKGLRINITTGDLETEDGSAVTTPVQLSIKELTSTQDIVANDCPTVSNGKLLETAGSYFIGVSGNGKNLRLKKGKTMKVEFPKRGAGMELFYGQRTADGSMNWQPMQKKLAGASLARENWEKEKKVLQERIATGRVAVAVKVTDGYGSAGTGRFLTPEAWFKAYHDTLVEQRRNIIRKNFKQMTQPQIRAVMEAPFRMSKNDLSKLMYLRTGVTDGSANSFYYNFDGFDMYISEIPGTDSVKYVRDSLRYRARMEAMRRESAGWAIDPNNTLERAVDSSGPGTTQKNDQVLTTPGKTKVTISYYEPVELEQLGWINCDRFYNYPDGTVPEYTLDIKGDVPPMVGVYMIYKNINGVMGTKALTGGKNTITILQQLPLNAPVEFLVYSKVKNQFVQCKITATVSKNMVIPVTFKPVPPGQVKKELFSQP
jgi:hypothetical protein